MPLVLLSALVYPFSMELFAYNLSVFFETPEVAAKVVPLCNMFMGALPAAAVYFLSSVAPDPYPDIALGIHLAMSALNPLYMLPGVITMLLARTDGIERSAAGYFMSWAAAPLYLFPVSTALCGGHLLWRELRSYYSQPGTFQSFSNAQKDDDVLAEEHRLRNAVASGSPALAEEAVQYEELSHTYRSKIEGKWQETHAVRGISLGVRKGECFGLLGPNGAGKTTTLAVLTGEVRPPTAGSVTVLGHSLETGAGREAAFQSLGVCPQVDPLWPNLTGRDHLMYYGQVKGVPEEVLPGAVEALLRRLGLQADGDRMSSEYSGGMKRKLSVGIALLGHSPLMFLDEPSAAVDAGAKRHLWRVIKLRGPRQTVMLTTHSMEEAEALCDRIAIQVKGQLRCLGTPLHIKHKYGSGYQLELFCLASTPTANVLDFVRQAIAEEAQLLEHQNDRYLFQLPPMGGSGAPRLGRVFTELHAQRASVGITDYSLTQPSLEQVFIRFAKEQDELNRE